MKSDTLKHRDAHRDARATRRILLEAAAAQLALGGATRLTLDAVAALAGVSKGGLLHHFRNKDALLLGLAEGLMADFHRELEGWLVREPQVTSGQHQPAHQQPGRWTRAYIHATFAPQNKNPHEDAVLVALAGALSVQPELNAYLRGAMAFIEDASRQDGLPEAQATAIRLACDGQWLSELAGLPPVIGAARDALYAQLLSWATPGNQT
jgi:AcrR family transcriptional regulator